jgi:hypothetical protein
MDLPLCDFLHLEFRDGAWVFKKICIVAVNECLVNTFVVPEPNIISVKELT